MKRRAKSIIAGACLASLLALMGSHDVAAGEPGFTLASVKGAYAKRYDYRPQRWQHCHCVHLRREGNFSGSGILNIPSPARQRLIIQVTFAGTCTVNADGSGTWALTATLPDGRELYLNDDVVITEATRQGRQLVAAQLFNQR